MRHFYRHADGIKQRGVWVDRFADAHGVGAHVNVKKVLFKVHYNHVDEQKNPCNFLPFCLWQRTCSRMAEDFGQTDRQTVDENIAYVQYKWPIGKPRVDHLRGPIWEVRSKIGNRIARVLFAVEESEMILLHAFVKKTQQTNPADIELATKRLKEWINGQSN
jgi:phage-related protein